MCGFSANRVYQVMERPALSCVDRARRFPAEDARLTYCMANFFANSHFRQLNTGFLGAVWECFSTVPTAKS